MLCNANFWAQRHEDGDIVLMSPSAAWLSCQIAENAGECKHIFQNFLSLPSFLIELKRWGLIDFEVKVVDVKVYLCPKLALTTLDVKTCQRSVKLHFKHHQHVLAEPRAHPKGHKHSEGIKLLEGLGVAGIVNKLVDPQ